MDRDFTSDKLKNEDDYQIERIDEAINELVQDNYMLRKAFNYYNGVRDSDQYKHLEINYGIGTASSIEFTPLIRKHIDVLVGEFLSLDLEPTISCKDEKTITNIFRDKQLEIANQVNDFLKLRLSNAAYSALQGNKQPVNDKQVELEVNNLIDSIDANFISEYEKAGKNVIDYIVQSQHFDFKNKLKRLILHLLIGGVCYYRVIPSPSKDNFEIEVLNPLNTFIERNVNSPYVRDSCRFVYRTFLNKTQILFKYGKYLDEDQMETLRCMADTAYDQSYVRYLTAPYTISGNPISENLTSGIEVTVGTPNDNVTNWYRRLIPVYEIEWLSSKVNKKTKEVETSLYKGVRIGTELYLLFGKDEDVIVSSDAPNKAKVSINGLCYSDDNADPFSLILKTANLQDKYDLLHFFRDNLIANSGVPGDWVDLPMIPVWLGDSAAERLAKWIAYKKQGQALIDTTQEGAKMNTIFGGYDDSLKANAVQAIQMAIESVEETASSITGVFKERLAGFEQRDAVSNVQVGIKQSMFVTKQYFQNMDLLTRDILIDCLNQAKTSFKKGLTGSIILGDYRKKVFTALPKHFTVTDYDIHIVDSSKIVAEKQMLQQFVMELTKAGKTDADIIVEVATSHSLTEMKDSVNKSLKKKKEEEDAVKQLQEKLEQSQKELQHLQEENKQVTSKLEKINNEKLQIEAKKVDYDFNIKNKELSHKIQQDTWENEFKNKELDVEKAQLFDSNPHNDVIKKI